VNALRADRFTDATGGILPSVQWLRAIAAMMVVVHHVNFYADGLREQAGATNSSLAVAFSSIPWSFGIHIFFVISGFIMILTTKNFGEPGAWKVFLLRRLSRIVPLYWVLTTLTVVVLLTAPRSMEIAGSKLSYILSSYFFIPVLRAPDDLRPILGPGWTLNFEMYFYVAMALATLWPRRLGVAILTVAFVGLAWYGRDLDKSTPILFAWTDGIILEFILGIFLGLLYETGRRIHGAFAAGLIVAGTALAIAEFPWPAVLSAGTPAMMIVGGFVLCPPLKDSVATQWLTHLGNASYSIYLTHILVLRPFRDVWVRLMDGPWSPLLFFCSGVVLSAAVGCLIHYLLEKPVTRYLPATEQRAASRRLSRHPTRDATMADGAADLHDLRCRARSDRD
jgi:peptidoglycan/LPS O-acetylase OafA/YrhL